jgi:hypothetical protein
MILIYRLSEQIRLQPNQFVRLPMSWLGSIVMNYGPVLMNPVRVVLFSKPWRIKSLIPVTIKLPMVDTGFCGAIPY